MRILGAAANDELLLSASKQEIANLIGYGFSGQSGMPPLKPGLEIRVHAMFEQLRTLKYHEDRLAKVAAELRAYADRLEAVEPVVLAVTQEIPEGPDS